MRLGFGARQKVKDGVKVKVRVTASPLTNSRNADLVDVRVKSWWLMPLGLGNALFSLAKWGVSLRISTMQT